MGASTRRAAGLAGVLGAGAAAAALGAGVALAAPSDAPGAPTQTVTDTVTGTVTENAPVPHRGEASAVPARRPAPRTDTAGRGPRIRPTSLPAARARAATPSLPDLVRYTVFHRSPTASPAQSPGQSPAGVVTGNLNATSPDGNPMTFALTRVPVKGSVTIAPDGGYSYTPGPGLALTGGTDTFGVTIDDGAPYRLTGVGGAVQGILAALAQLVGLRQPDTVTVAVGVAVSATEPPQQGEGDYILIRRDALLAKPTAGPGWEFLTAQADAVWDAPDLAALNTKTPAMVLAAALVYARTGDAAYRDKVIAAVTKAPGTEDTSGVVLPFARNVFGYVVAADLVGMPLDTVTDSGETWRSFLERARTEEFTGNTRWISLEKTSGDSAANWNAYALSSHLAISVALGEEEAVARDVTIFRRFLGDTTSPWPAFAPTSGHNWNGNGATWDMTPTLQRGINPERPGESRSGAIILDASRHTSLPSVPCCTTDLAGRAYIEESLDALLAVTMVLAARGQDFTDFEDQAIRRAYDFLVRNGGPSGYSNGRYLALAINNLYGTGYPTSAGDSVARHLGYGAWLFGG